MVLSNKKLKKKLRAARAESLAATLSGEFNPLRKSSSTNADTNSDLKELLEASRRKIRLLKKDKRRKAAALRALDGTKDGEQNIEVERNRKNEDKEEGGLVGEADNGENNDNEETKKKRNKKRKREEGESKEEGVKEDGVAKKAKEKKKKKKKKKAKSREKIAEEAKGITEAKEEISGRKDDIATKVYVGGIPYYSTEEDIRSFFEHCGTITEVDCMSFPDSGKFRGIAIISFKTEPAAKRALAHDGADMGGCYLKIQPYKTTRANKVSNFAPDIVQGYNRIYVGNLSWDITEDDLRKFFSDCEISSIRFGIDKETGEFRGYAHVDFSDEVSLLMALKLDQQIVCGRPIKISCAVLKKDAKDHAVSNIRMKNHLTTVPTNKDTDNKSSTIINKINDTNNSESSSTSKKIKRRTCYDCGEKGHISTDCPKNQGAGQTNSNTT